MGGIKHGAAKRGKIKRLYRIWSQMRQRCNNPNDSGYMRYGGRGICVCEEWQDDYAVFESWALQNGYDDNLSIDRIDSNDDYRPENCRWANDVEQANNKENVEKYEYNGEKHSVAEWARIMGINREIIKDRLLLGWSFEQALLKPVKKIKKHKYPGTFYDETHCDHPWRAYISINSKRIRLGNFKTLKEAVIARRQAEVKHKDAKYTADELLGVDVTEEDEILERDSNKPK